MTSLLARVFGLGVTVGLLALQGCSSDGESTSTENAAGADNSGSGASASGGSASGGEASGTGGNSSGGQPNSGGQANTGGSGDGDPGPTVCGTVVYSDEEGCATLPPACGGADDYAVFLMGTPSDDKLGDQGAEVYFGLGGADEFKGYAVGSCLIGGDGDDEMSFFDGGVAEPTTSIGVGGPGLDAWYLGAANLGAPMTFADVEANEPIQFLGGYFGITKNAPGADFVELIANFDGASPPITKATTRIVYDSVSGKIWSDKDGSGVDAAVHVATVGNAPQVTLTTGSFYSL